MTTFTDTWNDTFEAKPDDDNYGYEIDNYIRKLQIAIRERMEVEHIWKIGATDGEHSPGECKIVYVGTKSTFPTAKKNCMAIATDESNRPYICLVDGTWTVFSLAYINANIEVADSVTIDGVDISAHAAGTAKSQHTAGMGDHTHESTGAEGGRLTSIFGVWASKSEDTVYTAATDGEVHAYATSVGNNCTLTGYTDSNNPPTTVRVLQKDPSDNATVCIKMSVRKGDYWKVVAANESASYIFWLPIGG